MATKSKVKQYIATYEGRVEVIDFREFQAESIGAKLTEDGLAAKDAEKLIEKWNTNSVIKFSLPESK